MARKIPAPSRRNPPLTVPIFLSMPGDLDHLRPAIKSVISALNRDRRFADQFEFIDYAYYDGRTHLPGLEMERPAERYPPDDYNIRPEDADIFVCLFWKRLGRPTTRRLVDPTTNAPYPSGTVYELLRAHEYWRRHDIPAILLYRCTEPSTHLETRGHFWIQTPEQEQEQEQELDSFLARCASSGELSGLTVGTFTSAEDLMSRLFNDVALLVTSSLAGAPVSTVALRIVPASRSLAKEARRESLTSSEGLISSCAFSPDGQLLATASDDGAVRLRKATNGRQLRILTGHRGPIWSCAFSPDGRFLATAGYDRTARLWDIEATRTVQVFEGHNNWVNDCAFSPDGTVLATVGGDGMARLWEIATGRELSVLEGHNKWVNGCAFSPDGQLLATASTDGTARLWQVTSGRNLHVLTGHNGPVYRCRFSPDGQLLATASDDRTVRLWETGNGRELRVLEGHKMFEGHRGPVKDCAFTSAGKLLATVSDDKTVRLWDVASGIEVAYSTLDSPACSCASHPHLHILAVGGATGEIQLGRVEPSRQSSRALQT